MVGDFVLERGMSEGQESLEIRVGGSYVKQCFTLNLITVYQVCFEFGEFCLQIENI